MNKLQIVIDKICELLKGTELDPMYQNSMGGWMRKPIREAEVLMALEKEAVTEGYWCIITDGEIYNPAGFDYPDDSDDSPHWQLGRALSDQSPETIEFLFNCLNCEG